MNFSFPNLGIGEKLAEAKRFTQDMAVKAANMATATVAKVEQAVHDFVAPPPPPPKPPPPPAPAPVCENKPAPVPKAPPPLPPRPGLPSPISPPPWMAPPPPKAAPPPSVKPGSPPATPLPPPIKPAPPPIASRTKGQVAKMVDGLKGMVGSAQRVAEEKIWCPIFSLYDQGRANAKAANAEKSKWELGQPGASSGPATDWASKTPHRGKKLKVEKQEAFTAGVGVGVSAGKEKEVNFLRYGDDENHVKVGVARAGVSTGYEFDPVGKSESWSVVKAEAGVALIEAKASGKSESGLTEYELTGEALSAKAGGEVSVKKDEHGVVATAQVGAEANLVKVGGTGSINLTAKTVYDNTIGSVVWLVDPGSKYVKLSDDWDHGLVIGVAGEAGIGAAAKAELSAGRVDDVWGVTAGATAGFGPMAGIKLFFGVK
jgi:hypothetical protein